MVKILARHISLFLLCFAVLAGCGKDSEKDSLRVLLKIPDGESEDLFWFGVEKRELEVNGKEGSTIHPWNTGQAVEVDLREGDTLVFRAYNSEGRVLVTGEAAVGEAKMVSIPLRRVL